MHAIGILTLAGLGITLAASNASALRFTDASYLLPKGVVGKPYLHVFELAKGGGSPPYHYKIPNNGKLPPGLTLDEAQGTLHGTPQSPGAFLLAISVKDGNGSVGVARMLIEVQAAGDRK